MEAQQLARAAGRQAVAAMNFSDASDEEDELIASIIDSSNAAVAEAIRWEDKNEPTKGSRPGKSSNLPRDHAAGHQRIFADYFCEHPVYPERLFRRRYRMSKRLFLRVLDAVCQADPYFVQKPDATGKMGLSPLQKVTAALRMLAYGVSGDLVRVTLP